MRAQGRARRRTSDPLRPGVPEDISARGMRTRLIRPTFWSDASVAALSVPARLTLLGLWGMSDDDGYFEWKPSEIAAELYRYATPKARIKAVEDHLALVVVPTDGEDEAIVLRLDCGRHGRIPSMPKHRIQSGRHTFPIRDQHLGECVAGRGIPRHSASRSLSDTESESGSVRNGSVSGAQPRADKSPLDAVALTIGGPVAAFARGKIS